MKPDSTANAYDDQPKRNEKWPSFFLVGAPRTGTTTLYHQLHKLPGVCMSKIKMPNYFSTTTLPTGCDYDCIRDEREYLALFEHAKDGQILGEGSLSYLPDPDVPNAIKKVAPGAKILISLRDPIERLRSHYLVDVHLGQTQSGFAEYVHDALNHKHGYGFPYPRVRFGLYSNDISRYLDTFGGKHVKIIVLEEWRQKVPETIEGIAAFLSLEQPEFSYVEVARNEMRRPRGVLARYALRSKVIGKAMRFLPQAVQAWIDNALKTKLDKPSLDEQDMALLKEFYEDDVRRVEKILGRKMPWKNF